MPVSPPTEGDPVEASEGADERPSLKLHRVVPRRMGGARWRRVLDGDVVKGDGGVGLPPLVLISADHQSRWISLTLHIAQSDKWKAG